MTSTSLAVASLERPVDTVDCRILLLELIRRAAFDWILYRNSTRIAQKKLALDAYTWLFEEEPGDARWLTRKTEGKLLTAFVSVCEALSICPHQVRERVRLLQVTDVRRIDRFRLERMTVGVGS